MKERYIILLMFPAFIISLLVAWAVHGSAATVDFTATPQLGGVPLQVAFTDTSNVNPTAWQWDFGDGGTSVLQNPMHTYNSTGTFTVGLTVTNAQGSANIRKADLIQVVDLPIATFTRSAGSGDVPFTVAFTDVSIGLPTDWAWSFGDGGTSTLQNPTHVYTLPGTYDVALTVTNVAGSDTLTRTDYIHVTVPMIEPGIQAHPLAGGSPLSVNFTDGSTGFGISGWFWDFGDGFTSTAQNPQHLYTAAGSYTVGLTVTDQAGQSTSDHKIHYITVYTSGSFQGIIQNAADHSAIPGATVGLARPGHLAGSATTVTTLADGSWNLILPDNGTVYTFRATAPGFMGKSFNSVQLARAVNGIIELSPAGAQIQGTVVPVPVIPARVSVFVDPGNREIGSELTTAGGVYDVGVAAGNAAGLTYMVGAVEPGSPGRMGKTAFAGPLTTPTPTVVNINTSAVPGNFIDGPLGGFSDTVNLAGYNIPLVEAPAGTTGADANVSFTQVANPDPMNEFAFASGLNLYEIKMNQALLGYVIVTLPFDLTRVNPGDFEAGIISVIKAPTLDDLLNGMGMALPPIDILSVDYIGDGVTGLVSFRVSSLSVFGIGMSFTCCF